MSARVVIISPRTGGSNTYGVSVGEAIRQVLEKSSLDFEIRDLDETPAKSPAAIAHEVQQMGDVLACFGPMDSHTALGLLRELPDMLFISPCATSQLLRSERLSPNALFFCANSDDEARVKSLFDLIPEKHFGFPMIITETNQDRTRQPFGEQQAHFLRRRLEEMGHPHIWCSFPRQRPDALFDKTSAMLEGLKTTKPSSYVLLGRTVDTASVLAQIRRRDKFTPVMMVSPSLELLAQQPDYKKWRNLFVVLDDARLVEDTSTKMRAFRNELRARRIDFHEYAYFAHDAAVIFVSAVRATAHITDAGNRRRSIFERLVSTQPDPMQNERLVLTQSAAGNTMQLTHVARRLSRGTWVQGLEVEKPGLPQRFLKFNQTPAMQLVLFLAALASIVGVALAVAALPSCHPGSAAPSIHPLVDGK